MYQKFHKLVRDIAILGPFRTGRAVAGRLGIFAGPWRGILPASPRFGSGQLAFLYPFLEKGGSQEGFLIRVGDMAALIRGPDYWLNGSTYTVYYKDIAVHAAGIPDIKDAWFRGRCHEAVEFAWAYHITRQEKYREAVLNLIDDWITCNPYEYGLHWVGPMEVAIRAVNWIIALDIVGNNIDSSRYDRIVESLWQHMQYLEHRWELYDGRTNNHYLANLVGYLYVCWFFYDTPGVHQKLKWCLQEIAREWDWQVFDEGTSYEGSTQYHGLVMELLFFAQELARGMSMPFDGCYENKFARMATFYMWCQVNERGDRIVIGDDGSDFLVPLVSRDAVAERYATPVQGVADYPEYGVSFFKHNDFHISLRHPAWTARQPSGHFHTDRASVTIAYREIPIIIDPGSYVYTRSPAWRNYFRSVAVHNTFFVEGQEPANLGKDLFYWEPDEQERIAQRTISLESNLLTIRDCWKLCTHNVATTIWNFTCAPGISLQQIESGWLFLHAGKPILRMHSPQLIFEAYEAWACPAYGIKKETWGLRARAPLSEQEYVIYFVPAESSCL